jgi:hypothetical protein
MPIIFKITIEDNDIYLLERVTRNCYELMDEYVPIIGDVIVTDINTEDAFSIESLPYQRIVSFLTHICISAKQMLPNGMDDLDLSFDHYSGRYDVRIVTRWGDIEITNSNDQKHPILGIYTKASLSIGRSGTVIMRNFQILRDIYTDFEKTNGHIHSHVPKDSYVTGFNRVCIGESDLKRIFMTRRVSMKNFDVYRLLMYIDSFIRWESLEGGPYFKITDLYTKISTSVKEDIPSEIMIEVVNDMDIEILLTPYDLKIPENLIAEAVIKNLNIKKTLPNSSSVKKDNWWNEYSENSSITCESTYFRGKNVVINIIPTTEEHDALTDTVFNSYNTSTLKQLSDKFTTILTDNPWRQIVEVEIVKVPIEEPIIFEDEEEFIIINGEEVPVSSLPF